MCGADFHHLVEMFATSDETQDSRWRPKLTVCRIINIFTQLLVFEQRVTLKPLWLHPNELVLALLEKSNADEDEEHVGHIASALISIQPDMLLDRAVRAFVLDTCDLEHCFEMYLKSMSHLPATEERRRCLREIREHLFEYEPEDIYDSIFSWAESSPGKHWDIDLFDEFLSFIDALWKDRSSKSEFAAFSAQSARYGRQYLTTVRFQQFMLCQL